MKEVYLSLRDECMKDKRHNYMVDGWVGMHSWWETEDRLICRKRDLAVSAIVNGTNAGGRRSVENGLNYLRENLSLRIDENDGMYRVSPVDKPFWKVGRASLEQMLTHLTARQFKLYLACARVWSVSRYRGCDTITSMGQLAKVMGMTDCPNNTKRLKEDMKALIDNGLVSTSQVGRMTRLDKVSQGWKGVRDAVDSD